MTDTPRPDFRETMRRAIDSALLAMDRLAREMNFPPGSSGAVTLEAQREILLAVATMGELVTEVAQNQNEFFTSPAFNATVERAMRVGADRALKAAAGENQRRLSPFTAAIIFAMVALGVMLIKPVSDIAYSYGAKSTLAAECARDGTPMARERELACELMMPPKPIVPPKLDIQTPIGVEPGQGKNAPPVFRYASPADSASPVPPR